jgi:hypothetical protein
MTTISKIGAALLGLGVFVWVAPTLFYHYPIREPLSVALPLSRGTSLREQFTVRGSERYELLLRCTEVGEFREKWANFLNWKEHPTIPCHIGLRVLREGHEVHSAYLTSLEPSGLSGHEVFWNLGPLASLSSGRHELQLTNGTDLSYLAPTEPTIKIQITPVFIVNSMFGELLGRVAGGALLILGIGIFIVGLVANKRRANPPASVDGGITPQSRITPARPATTEQGRYVFVSRARYVSNHRKNPATELSIFGQERVAETIRLCKMNLAVHGKVNAYVLL